MPALSSTTAAIIDGVGDAAGDQREHRRCAEQHDRQAGQSARPRSRRSSAAPRGEARCGRRRPNDARLRRHQGRPNPGCPADRPHARAARHATDQFGRERIRPPASPPPTMTGRPVGGTADPAARPPLRRPAHTPVGEPSSADRTRPAPIRSGHWPAPRQFHDVRVAPLRRPAQYPRGRPGRDDASAGGRRWQRERSARWSARPRASVRADHGPRSPAACRFDPKACEQLA